MPWEEAVTEVKVMDKSGRIGVGTQDSKDGELGKVWDCHIMEPLRRMY